MRPRVLIVDDSAVVRNVMCTLVDADPDLELAGARASGDVALQTIDRDPPDVIILDVEMPGMDGIEVLKHLRRRSVDIPVFMFSALTERSAKSTIDALALGAIDFVLKPTGNWSPNSAREQIRAQLIDKITALFRASPRTSPSPIQPTPSLDHPPRSRALPRILAIGCSTGGPNALATLLPKLPGNLPVPVLIAQHMPPMFTAHLARRLDAASELTVREGVDGVEIRPGEAWIAPGDFHMRVEHANGHTRLCVDQSPPINSCRPSIDVLISSLAEQFGAQTLAVMLTGMGSDGLGGCERLHAKGGQILAQDRESSVVWGIPGAVCSAGLTSEVQPLEQLADAIMRRIELRHGPQGSRVSALPARSTSPR